MLNAERFKKEILEKSNVLFDFSISKDRHTIEKCLGVCDDCIFCNIGEHCSNVKVKWLLSEYKEPVKLTRLEYGLLSFWNKEYKYIARDSNNMVFVYREKPSKNSKVWGSLHEHRVIDDLDKLFLFVKWEDTEPRAIKEILKNCEVIDDDLSRNI